MTVHALFLPPVLSDKTVTPHYNLLAPDEHGSGKKTANAFRGGRLRRPLSNDVPEH